MLLVIFGAGASYDNNIGVLTGNEYPRLPLTNNLIDTGQPSFQSALTKWPGAVPILNRLNRHKGSTQQTFNLEEALYAELEKNVKAVNDQLLGLKFYIHEIIRNCEQVVRQRNQGNTNYTLLLNDLQNHKVDQQLGVALVTFNYDTLIETACTQLYPDWEFNKFDDYIMSNSMVRLYKPHGSLNWKQNYLITYQPGKNGTIKVLVNPKRYNLMPQIKQISAFNNDYNNEAGNNFVDEPILALPYREKTSLVFMDNHRDALLKDIEKVTHILTIGWRGTEEHFYREIMSKLNKSIKVLNVSNGSIETEKNLRKHLNDKIVKIDTFPSGFSKFLESEKILPEFVFS